MIPLIENYKMARQTFIDTVDAFPTDKREAILFDEWSLKDILAHLIGWERQSIQQIVDLRAQKSLNWIYDMDAFNAKSTARYKNTDWERVYTDFLESGKTLIETYESLPIELWHTQAGPKPHHTPERFLIGATEHLEREHLASLKKVAIL